MECFIRGGEKCLAEIKNSRHLLIYSNRKKPASVAFADRLPRSLLGDPFGSPVPQRPQPLDIPAGQESPSRSAFIFAQILRHFLPRTSRFSAATVSPEKASHCHSPCPSLINQINCEPY